MLRLKSILPLFLAFWVATTSLGVVISSHRCNASGKEEVSLGALKACCGNHDAEGFRAESCCTVKIQKVKLPTFRLADPVVEAPVWNAVSVAIVNQFDLLANLETRPFVSIPSDAPPIKDGRHHLLNACTFLI